MPKNFFLGVGAMKAGTTWIYEYLRHYPNFNFNNTKQYHIWDRMFIDEALDPKKGKVNHAQDQLDVINNPGQYFSSLVTDGIDSTGDITPRYALLKSEHFSEIKQKLEAVDFNIKVIFIMRDPVDRCLSHAKMMKEHEMLDKVYSSYSYFARTDYKSTISNLEAVFSPDQIYYGIFEEMFSREKIDELSQFCGVAPDYSYSNMNPNPSKINTVIDDKLKHEITEFYSEIYEFCLDRFPQTQSLWSK